MRHRPDTVACKHWVCLPPGLMPSSKQDQGRQAADQAAPMKMMDGERSAATANSALTCRQPCESDGHRGVWIRSRWQQVMLAW